MKDHVAACHQPCHPEGVRDVTRHHFKVLFDVRGQKLQQSPVIPGVVMHQGPDLCPSGHQGFRQMTAQKAAGPGYQYLFILPFHQLFQNQT
jgi:hypothetical protein